MRRRIRFDQPRVGADDDVVPAAGPPPRPMASRRLGEATNLVRAARDAQRLRLPERESIDRPGRPRPAGLAMAIAHRRGLAGHGELDRTAEAAALVHLVVHVFSFRAASMRRPGGAAFTGTPRFLTETPWMHCQTS